MALAVGAALVVAGVAMLAGRDVGVRGPKLLRPAGSTGTGYSRVATFGAGYAIASLSCTIAVVLAVAGQATATANAIQFLVVFGAFAAGASSARLALSLSIAMASTVVARAMRRVGPAMHTIAGALLAASGAYLIVYWRSQVVVDGGPGSSSTRTVDEVSASVANFLTAHTGAFAIALALIVMLALGSHSEPARLRPVSAEARARPTDAAGRHAAPSSTRGVRTAVERRAPSTRCG